jgi:cell division septation protein DedD
VVADLARDTWPAVGRIADGAADLWLPLAWTPEAMETAAAGPDTSAAAADSTAPAAARTAVYLQVSSSQNPAWARDLAGQLRDAGLPASVLEPTGPDEGYRVVLGPYASREEAESAGRKLGRPFFIYQPGIRAGQ